MNAPPNQLPAKRDAVAEMTLADAERLPLLRLAEFAGRSNFFNCSNQEQAVMKLLMGQELGFSPCASLSGIHIVEGRPMVGANMYASAIKAHAHYDYKAETSRTACRVTFFADDAELGSYGMTLEEATAAGLTHSNSGKHKANWRRHPDAMLFARCISQGARFHCPDVFGGMAVYTEGEIEEPERVSVEIVGARVTATPQGPPPCDGTTHPNVHYPGDGTVACVDCGELLLQKAEAAGAVASPTSAPLEDAAAMGPAAPAAEALPAALPAEAEDWDGEGAWPEGRE